MYVMVVGCGRIGFHLARALLASDNEVVVIERDTRRGEEAAEQLGSVVIASDGTEPSVLREAGANRCDVFVSTTGVDATNLAACQVAKWSFRVPKTVAVVTDPDHVPLFRSLGVDVNISTTDLILANIEEEIPASALIHVLPMLGGGKGVVGVKVPADSAAVGRSVRELAIPPGTAVAVVIGRDGALRTIDDDLRLEADDEVVAITTPDQEEDLWHVLTSGG